MAEADHLSDDKTLNQILIGDNLFQFWITFLLSLFSASFGLAKCLKNGVAGTFQHGGVLDGLCSVQFILAFLGKGVINNIDPLNGGRILLLVEFYHGAVEFYHHF